MHGRALASGDTQAHEQISEAAGTGREGFLARDCETGCFRLLGEAETDRLLEGRAVKAAPELELVDTQDLRKALGMEAEKRETELEEREPTLADDPDGCDPYNSAQ